jgi:hypothetical protein
MRYKISRFKPLLRKSTRDLHEKLVTQLNTMRDTRAWWFYAAASVTVVEYLVTF